jgi:hypothetical protein
MQASHTDKQWAVSSIGNTCLITTGRFNFKIKINVVNKVEEKIYSVLNTYKTMYCTYNCIV